MLYPSGGDICIAADAATPYFTSVSVLDTSGRARCTDIKTFLGFSSQLYMNAESLYLSGARYDGGAKTQLVRFSRTGDGLEFAAEGCVPGSLLNQFSMDEYDGVLRVAVTETDRNGESTNSLYTLRQEGGALVVAGALTGMGITERIYGVRFFGETGYIVTFRQTDPLYTLDLSDPERPRLCSELKITGYSAYLHVYGAGRLFGFGNEATQDGSVQSLKLTMFDTADPSAVPDGKRPRARRTGAGMAGFAQNAARRPGEEAHRLPRIGMERRQRLYAVHLRRNDRVFRAGKDCAAAGYGAVRPRAVHRRLLLHRLADRNHTAVADRFPPSGTVRPFLKSAKPRAVKYRRAAFLKISAKSLANLYSLCYNTEVRVCAAAARQYTHRIAARGCGAKKRAGYGAAKFQCGGGATRKEKETPWQLSP